MGCLCWSAIQYSHCREKLWTLCRKCFTTIPSWKYRTIGNCKLCCRKHRERRIYEKYLSFLHIYWHLIKTRHISTCLELFGMFLGRSLISCQRWPSLCKKKVNNPLSRPLCFWKTWLKMFTYDISFADQHKHPIIIHVSFGSIEYVVAENKYFSLFCHNVLIHAISCDGGHIGFLISTKYTTNRYLCTIWL
jgi:hypothetical protein